MIDPVTSGVSRIIGFLTSKVNWVGKGADWKTGGAKRGARRGVCGLHVDGRVPYAFGKVRDANLYDTVRKHYWDRDRVGVQ